VTRPGHWSGADTASSSGDRCRAGRRRSQRHGFDSSRRCRSGSPS
jgi:hypothetical protein